MTLTAYNHVPIPSFMYGTAWKEEATTELVQLAVASGFTAIDTANQLIHYQEALVGEALQALEKKGIKRDGLFLQTKFTPVHGQDHRTPYDASAYLTTQVNSPSTLVDPPLHRVCGLLCLTRTLFSGGAWGKRIGRCGRPWKVSINRGKPK